MSKDKSNGIGLGTVLTLIFLTLKLCGVITWSWWWVFSPIWLPLVVIVCILAVLGLIVWWNKR